ncbi:hypothetical protein [Zarconia navalis]|nr:hypothetical protein [Zarconia navalis]
MSPTISNTCRMLLGSTLIGAIGWGAIATGSLAWQGECVPPQPGEYLILVINPEEDEQEAVAELIPSERDSSICNYLGEIVTRVGGYRQQQDANGLAQTIAAQTGLGAFVTRPPQVAVPEEALSVESSAPAAEPPPSPPIAPSVEIAPNPLEATTDGNSASASGIPLIPGRAIEPAPSSSQSDRESPRRENPAPELISTATPSETRLPPETTLSPEPTTLPDLGLSSTALSPPESPTPDSPAYNPPPQVTASSQDNVPAPIPDLEARSQPPIRPAQSRELPEVPPLTSELPPVRDAVEATSPTSPVAPFNPQTLDAGYAILVDYLDRPELAAQIQQTVGKNVGLVSYGQRPYLLVMHTQDDGAANSTLQTLSANGFLAMIVDSRQVILLAPKVEQF